MQTPETFDKHTNAYVRKPGANFAQGISPAVGIPDVERAQMQHEAYCAALVKCGVDVQALRPDPLFPDGCFISDMAVVTENLAVISNFSNNSPRQGEQRSAAEILAGTRFLKFITSPGRLDSSDVLQIQNHFYIGLSDHTNQEGASQLAFFLKEFGYDATVLDLQLENIIRLKTAAVYLGDDRIMIREELAHNYAFIAYNKIIVPRHEKGIANAAMVNGTLLVPTGYPDTMMDLRIAGVPYIELNISEFEKMNGGITCLSLRPPAAQKGNVVLMTDLKNRKVA